MSKNNSERLQWIRQRHNEYQSRRQTFIEKFQCREIKWSAYNLVRLLRATGESPERLVIVRRALANLGMGQDWFRNSRSWPNTGGIFDHGEMFSQDGLPRIIVGHPYYISDEQQLFFHDLNQFTALRFYVDDIESYYGFNTHHIRIYLADPRKPYHKLPATPKTRAVAKAFNEEFK